jgi:AcrR family transcriptional regulator
MRTEIGLREQNKLDKRQRIRAAARELFSQRGYEAATLRQIAKRAHVGLGTLFNYAQDKRDLVFLIFNEELAAVTENALQAAQSHLSLVDQLVDIYRIHYEYFAKNPALSRILLRELTFYSEGKQAATFQEVRGRLIAGIENAVRASQYKKRILSREEPTIIARQIFFMCSGALRWWIANLNPDPREGVRDLRRLLELEVNGLQPATRGHHKHPAGRALRSHRRQRPRPRSGGMSRRNR